jgi:hypothetical protein
MDLTNYKIEKTFQTIKQVISTADLPVGIIYYLLQYLLKDIEVVYFSSVKEQNAELLAAKEDTLTKKIDLSDLPDNRKEDTITERIYLSDLPKEKEE